MRKVALGLKEFREVVTEENVECHSTSVADSSHAMD